MYKLLILGKVNHIEFKFVKDPIVLFIPQIKEFIKEVEYVPILEKEDVEEPLLNKGDYIYLPTLYESFYLNESFCIEKVAKHIDDGWVYYIDYVTKKIVDSKSKTQAQKEEEKYYEKLEKDRLKKHEVENKNKNWFLKLFNKNN